MTRRAFSDLTLTRELAPATVTRECARLVSTGRGCVRLVVLCPYYADCVENQRKGGAVMCEALVIERVGNREVAW